MSTTKSNDIALSYLKTLKLKPSKSLRPFWSSLSERNDKELVERLKAAMNSRAEGSKSEDIYTLKNNNLQLSLDFANFSADLYRKYFEWFQGRTTLQPKDLLDIGCDNGIVTCFYAKLFPDANIIGIDTNKEGIQCAIELAQRLSISNVTFLNGDIRDISKQIQNPSFDIITSLRSLHECVGEFPEPAPHWTTREVITEETNTQIQELLGIINKLLRDEKSELITCERLSWLGSIAQWVKELKAAALNIDWNAATYIQFHEVGEKQKMPVFVSHKQKKGINSEELLERLYEFALKEESISIRANTEYMDAPAEIIMVQTKDKTFLKGAQITFLNGSGTLRIEIWEHNHFVLFYQYSNTGYRNLTIMAEEVKEEVFDRFEEALQMYRGQDIEAYEEAKLN